MAQRENVCECFACDIPSLDTIKITRTNGEFPDNDNIVFNCLKNEIPVTVDSFGNYTLMLKDNVNMVRPLQIINLLDSQTEEQKNETINMIIGENSRMTVFFCDDSLPKNRMGIDRTVNIEIKKGGNLSFYKMENVNNSTKITSDVVFNMDCGCSLSSFFISLNGGNLTNNIRLNFNGGHSQCDINGLYLMDRQQSVSTQVEVYHYKDSCKSNQLFKGILDDEAKANFLGHVLVDYNAKNNDARQTNNNILLTDKAKVNTRPVLEIYNDDVKCSHGATTGQLDNQALYYLRTRGISEKQAKMLLMNAFCQSVLQKSNIKELKEGLSLLIQKRLEGELSMENPFKIIL